MPIAAVTAVATVGAAAIGSKAAKDSAKTAANAATQASDQNAQIAREQRDMMRSYIDPLTPYAYAGTAALANRAGLSRNLPRTPAANAPQPANLFAANANPVPGSGGNIFAQSGVAGGPGASSGGVYYPTADERRAAGGVDGGGRTGVINDVGFGGYGGNGTQYPQSGGIDYGRLQQDRPDVYAEFQRAQSTADRNSPVFRQKGLDSFEHYADYWLANKPAADTYQAPQVQPQRRPTVSPLENSNGGQPVEPANDGPYVPYGLDGVPLNEPTSAPRADATRPGAAPAPVFTRPDQPTFNDPGKYQDFVFDPSQLGKDAGYQFELAQNTKNLNNGFAGRGMIRSGAAAKALAEYTSGLANTHVNDIYNRQLSGWQANAGNANANRAFAYNVFANDLANRNRNFESDRDSGLNIWNTTQDRADRNFDLDLSRADARHDSDRAYDRSVFDTNRGFAADRFDRQTGDIYNLTTLGTGAINALGGVGTNYANSMMNSNNARADAIGNAAIASGNSTSNLFANAAQGIGSIYGAYAKNSNPFASTDWSRMSTASRTPQAGSTPWYSGSF